LIVGLFNDAVLSVANTMNVKVVKFLRERNWKEAAMACSKRRSCHSFLKAGVLRK
jgi:hypothetical protein